MTTSGTKNLQYSLSGGASGALPTADLVNVQGVLYGTTASGGTAAAFTMDAEPSLHLHHKMMTDDPCANARRNAERRCRRGS